METKPLLFGLIGFFIGGLIVSSASTYIVKPVNEQSSEMTMSQMTETLANKTGDDFDKTFLVNMIEHHEGAVDMAELATKNAKHSEVKKLSADIITAQEKEIADMKQWQNNWGYSQSDTAHDTGH